MSTIPQDEQQTSAGAAFFGEAQHLNWSSIPVEQIGEGIERQNGRRRESDDLPLPLRAFS